MSETAKIDWILGRLDAKLEYITKQLDESKEENKKLEERISALESRFWWAAGVAATVIFVGNIFLSKFGFKV